MSAPELAPQIVAIVIGSTFKGLIVGALAGWFAKKVRSVPSGLIFGLIVGYATQRWGVAAAPAVLR